MEIRLEEARAEHARLQTSNADFKQRSASCGDAGVARGARAAGGGAAQRESQKSKSASGNAGSQGWE